MTKNHIKILIDNGHGVNTPGKRSPDGRFREYAWAREIARAIVADCKDLGYDAELLVPEEYDVCLSARCYRANCWCDRLGIPAKARREAINWPTAFINRPASGSPVTV